MKFAAVLGLAAVLIGQSSSAPPKGMKSFGFSPPAEDLKLWLPTAYESDPKVARKYTRVPSVTNPDIVTLTLEFLKTKIPGEPALPAEGDLLRVDPTLVNLKFTGSIARWRGKPVAFARYEGFVRGEIGVHGRMAWLPLQPGTVVVNLYAEPTWVPTMNRDWDLILANFEGPIAELTLRERAPGRWLAAKCLAALGILIGVAGIVLLIARMNAAFGGPVVYVGILIPVIPVGYAFLHLPECWRRLLIVALGCALYAASMLLES